jgi:hypothetical protein
MHGDLPSVYKLVLPKKEKKRKRRRTRKRRRWFIKIQEQF